MICPNCLESDQSNHICNNKFKPVADEIKLLQDRVKDIEDALIGGLRECQICRKVKPPNLKGNVSYICKECHERDF